MPQGREMRVVLFSTVRANDVGHLGFLEDQRRLNVALTRAQQACCVLGSRETLRSSTPGGVWQKWLDHVEESVRSKTAAFDLLPAK